MTRYLTYVFLHIFILGTFGCDLLSIEPHRKPQADLPNPSDTSARILDADFQTRLSAAALDRTRQSVRYDGSYRKIAYPMGDVPSNTGVCTDVIVRSYRELGIDLQKEVHEDMLHNFHLYPQAWSLRRPDPNIDHRRVLNLEVFFSRWGLEVAPTNDPNNYLPGDIVTWTVHRNRPHIGIVVDENTDDGKTPLVVHNIGWGPKLEDVLFDFPITGHFRYAGPQRLAASP